MDQQHCILDDHLISVLFFYATSGGSVRMFGRDPDRPIDEIFNDIFHAAQQPRSPSLVFISFSTLLLKLSKQANQSSTELRQSVDDLKAHITFLDEKNGKLQNAVTWLTIVSVGLALLQVLLAALPYVYPVPNASPPSTATAAQVVAPNAVRAPSQQTGGKAVNPLTTVPKQTLDSKPLPGQGAKETKHPAAGEETGSRTARP